MKNCAVILAAGQGTRMKSELPKVLHEVCGRALVEHVLAACTDAGIERTVTVVGNGKEAVMARLEGKCEFAVQEQRLGTGHAAMMAMPALENEHGYCVICAGDMPLISGKTLRALMEKAEAEGLSACVLSASVADPTGYGRIVRDIDGTVRAIVEQKDATEEQKKIKEVNTSVYCFALCELRRALTQLRPNNAQGEYYLTDTLEILRQEGKRVDAFCMEDETEAMGINDRVQLARAQKLMQRRINEMHMREGVTLVDPDTIYIEAGEEIGSDTVIYPSNYLASGTRIGKNCTLHSGNRLENAVLGDGVEVASSTLLSCFVGSRTTVGPNAYLRPKAKIGEGARIGDFVEIKNAVIGNGSKVSHLSYVGDAEIGESCNIGCGVVFVNYDGKHKFRTSVGDRVFVGSNSNIVAPVTLSSGAYIAAGSTVTKSVEGGALCIARARQEEKPGWADRLREKWQSEEIK